MTAIKTQDKQTKILDTAAELFLSRGYDAVSLDDILERVGGSKTTLYSWYGGKEGLFGAMVERMTQDKLGPLLALDVSGLDPKAGLTAIGRTFLAVVCDSRGRDLYRMMIAEADRFPAHAAAFFKAGPETFASLVTRGIENWQKQGLLRAGDARMLAVQFIGMLLGDFSTRNLLGLASALGDQEIRVWVKQAVRLFLEGALPR